MPLNNPTDLASPAAIGSITPNTVAATTVNASAATASTSSTTGAIVTNGGVGVGGDVSVGGGLTANNITGYRPILSVTASKTFALSDAGTYQYCTNTGSITNTIPLNSVVAFPVGVEIENKKGGAGALLITATSGVSVLGDSGTALAIPLTLSRGCTLKKVASNTWILEGN